MTCIRHLRRRLALVPVLAAHAAVLALVMGRSGNGIVQAPQPRSIALFNVEPPVVRAPVRPVSPPSFTKAVVDRSLAPQLVSSEVVPSDSSPTPALSEADLAPGETCDIAGKVRTTLRDDPKIPAVLAMLPRDARSVANAVMLWDGRWIGGTTTSTRYALDQIRAAVIATVASAPAACRDEAQAGPTLMLLAGSPDTVLALGSGRWRWTDVFGAGAGTSTTVAARVDEAPSPAT